MSDILVVGSVAYDSIATPLGEVDRTLGGSANYFSLVASLFSPVKVVGVVGEDYEDRDLELLRTRSVDLEGLKRVVGKTFHWQGRYEADMNEAITLKTELNVFKDFNPTLPKTYSNSKYVFLANIDPELQIKVLDQVSEPRLVGADTMNFWIDSKRPQLLELLKRIDVLLINEAEVRQLTGQWNIVQSVKTLTEWGPKAVVVKRGEYGFVLFSEGRHFILPAFPVAEVKDPTGAGDSFAGGFFGYLSRVDKGLSWPDLKQACMNGCLLASFTVEDFGLSALRGLKWPAIEGRRAQYEEVIR